MDKNSEFCTKIEDIICIDPGKRGISKCFQKGNLFNAADSILKSEKNAPSYILTGFCCMHETCETDGPLGSTILCSMLRKLGYNSNLLCDSYAEKVVKGGALDNPVIVANDASEIKGKISFIISIERPGRSAKTKDYRTMTAKDITKVTAPLDFLFPNNIDNNKKDYLTISVGDGGNEVGTGNIMNLIIENVPLGESICTISTCDYLIMAGVSNWGGIGIAAALAILSNDKSIGEYFCILMKKQPEILKGMIENGAYDGVSGDFIYAIDGMKFENEHSKLNFEIMNIVKQKYLLE